MKEDSEHFAEGSTATPITANLLADGADLVVSERRASISFLQRRLYIGYAQALRLVASLASAGVVEEPNPEGRYHVALARLERHDRHASPLACHVRTLADLALYLVESHGYENTECVPMLAAPFTYRKEDLVPLVAEVLANRPHDRVAAVALMLSTLPEVTARFRASDAREALLAEVRRLPGAIDRGMDKTSWRHAGMLRAVRYIERRSMENITAHSRPFELFLHDTLVPQGRALEVHGQHREHVVPCAFLREKAAQLLAHGIPEDEVSEWLEPYVRIVLIDEADADRLDCREGLRDVMPASWHFGRNCMYQRLHHIGVRFAPPAEGPGCACAAGVGRAA
jgi:hypothetical protein